MGVGPSVGTGLGCRFGPSPARNSTVSAGAWTSGIQARSPLSGADWTMPQPPACLTPNVLASDPLASWQRFSFTHNDFTHDVFRNGQGPVIVVIHELPGIAPNHPSAPPRIRQPRRASASPTVNFSSRQQGFSGRLLTNPHAARMVPGRNRAGCSHGRLSPAQD